MLDMFVGDGKVSGRLRPRVERAGEDPGCRNGHPQRRIGACANAADTIMTLAIKTNWIATEDPDHQTGFGHPRSTTEDRRPVASGISAMINPA